MNKRGGLVLSVIILVVVFVAGAIVGGPVVSTVAQSPRSFSTAPIIANACNADEVCEVNKLEATSDVITNGLIASIGNIHNLGANNSNLNFVNMDGDALSIGGDVSILGDLTLNGAYNVECNSFPRNGSGENTCLTNGYNYCLFAEYHKTTQYLDGLEACNGEVQVELVEPYVGSCPGAGGGGGGGCGFNSEGVEPYYGVYRETLPGEINVLCCRTAGSGGGGGGGSGSGGSGGGGGGSSGSSDEG